MRRFVLQNVKISKQFPFQLSLMEWCLFFFFFFFFFCFVFLVLCTDMYNTATQCDDVLLSRLLQPIRCKHVVLHFRSTAAKHQLNQRHYRKNRTHLPLSRDIFAHQLISSSQNQIRQEESCLTPTAARYSIHCDLPFA